MSSRFFMWDRNQWQNCHYDDHPSCVSPFLGLEITISNVFKVFYVPLGINPITRFYHYNYHPSHCFSPCPGFEPWLMVWQVSMLLTWPQWETPGMADKPIIQTKNKKCRCIGQNDHPRNRLWTRHSINHSISKVSFYQSIEIMHKYSKYIVNI